MEVRPTSARPKYRKMRFAYAGRSDRRAQVDPPSIGEIGRFLVRSKCDELMKRYRASPSYLLAGRFLLHSESDTVGHKRQCVPVPSLDNLHFSLSYRLRTVLAIKKLDPNLVALFCTNLV